MGVHHQNAYGAHGARAAPAPAAKDPVKAAYRLVQQVWDQPVTVNACNRHGEAAPFSFRYLDYIANGTFGVVCRARDLATGDIVAIKTVYQDEAHQNRELAIGRSLDHANVVQTRCYFHTRNDYGEEFLSLVLEWMPTSVDRLLREHERRPGSIPLVLIQHSMLQFARALQYLHGVGICHRDIKPHNLLLDATTGMVKLCDFGCSKRLQPGEANIQYICARYYRAPEILLGWTRYSAAIDLWSAGCVMAELLTGLPIFPGKNSIDQLARIVRVLGPPTAEEMISMGQAPKQLSSRGPLSFSERRAALAAIVLGHREVWADELAVSASRQHDASQSSQSTLPDTSQSQSQGVSSGVAPPSKAVPPLLNSAIDLLAALLSYDPAARPSPTQIIGHAFLAEMQPLPGARIPGAAVVYDAGSRTQHTADAKAFAQVG